MHQVALEADTVTWLPSPGVYDESWDVRNARESATLPSSVTPALTGKSGPTPRAISLTGETEIRTSGLSAGFNTTTLASSPSSGSGRIATILPVTGAYTVLPTSAPTSRAPVCGPGRPAGSIR